MSVALTSLHSSSVALQSLHSANSRGLRLLTKIQIFCNTFCCSNQLIIMIASSNRTYCLRLVRCSFTLSEADTGNLGTIISWVQAAKVLWVGTTT